MNRKELSEIRNHFGPEAKYFSMDRVLTAFVDSERNVRALKIRKASELTGPETEILFETMKKVLNCNLGKQSSEMAFKIAGSLALKDACAKANPVLLEPVYELHITVPDNYLGDIMGDMNKRRGRILGSDNLGTKTCITVEVPQAEMFRYATDLRSKTQGRGQYAMEPSHYMAVPKSISDEIITSRSKG